MPPSPPTTNIDQKNELMRNVDPEVNIARPKVVGRGITCRPSIDVSKEKISHRIVMRDNSDLTAISPSSVMDRKTFSNLTISPLETQPPPKHTRSKSYSFGVVPRASPNCLKSLQSKLAFRRSKYGDTHPSVGVLWNRIGNFYFRANQYDDALGAYKQAVQCDNGKHLAASYANIGTVYWTTGEVDMSISFLNKALDVHELNDVLRERNPDESAKIADISYQIGLAQILNQKLDEAMSVLERAQRIQVSVYGNSSLAFARTLDAMGTVYRLKGNLFEALNHHERALNMKEKFADEPSTIIASMSNIASVHYCGNNLKEALLVYGRVLLKQQELLNKCKYDKRKDLMARIATEVGETLQIMGDIYVLLKDEQEAKRCYNETALLFQEAGL